MPTEYALERDDKGPIGSMLEVESLISASFPLVEFAWLPSGQGKLAMTQEYGVDLPSEIKASLERLPALREGRSEDGGAVVIFGLGHQEPVMCIYIQWQREDPSLAKALSALEAGVGGTMVVSGEETNRTT